MIWWLWVLFAVGNLIDLAVQGRDHLSLVAAFTLLLVTGIVYMTAQRPRIVADADGLTITNPLRDHRVGWAAVAGADPTDLLRVRCEWPDGDGTARRAIYSWAVHSSRRRQVTAEMRAQRQSRQADPRRLRGFGWRLRRGLGWAGALGTSAEPPRRATRSAWTPVASSPRSPRAPRRRGWTRRTPRRRRRSRPGTWLAVASVVVPGLALLVAVLA